MCVCNLASRDPRLETRDPRLETQDSRLETQESRPVTRSILSMDYYKYCCLLLPVNEWPNFNEFWFFAIQETVWIRHVEYVHFC